MPHRSPVPLTGAQYELAAAGYTAVITELGAGLRSLEYLGRPLVASYQPDELPPGAAGQLLAPWPNRVDGGRYEFAGVSHQLDLSEPAHGNAIHGLTRWARWQATSRTASAVGLRLALGGWAGYPFCLEMTVEYRVSAGGLAVTTGALNAGSRAAPYGTGHHPYLVAGDGQVDEWELTLPASRWLPTGERGIPAGEVADVAGTPQDFRAPRRLGATRLDHCLTGLASDGDGLAWAHLAGGGARVSLWAGPGYRWLQVFTGDTLAPGRRRRAVAVEPMTCPPNAFISRTDLATLIPGARVTHSWGIQAGR